MPTVSTLNTSGSMEEHLPEYQPLLLPSSFDVKKWEKLDLVAAGDVKL